ncbi:hypothetical protein HanHA300_Chr07g0231741 [Helianthus annuus]|nr:hypothetical protein HanHA300_Chr07g0231741 [Helianthus annuus]KAJ0562232.1 hypothetical protein HanHA89_Chr07g0248901 [Helianthus annuus]KAJ0727607.1 hypothetical protein HanLR1_Chr07g0231701 [Helianthus annuus]
MNSDSCHIILLLLQSMCFLPHVPHILKRGLICTLEFHHLFLHKPPPASSDPPPPLHPSRFMKLLSRSIGNHQPQAT